MQVSQSYGARRVKEIAAKVAKCRAALPVATEVPQTGVQAAPVIEAPTETRAPFVIEFPRERESHLKAQRRMFAAIKSAGLPLTLSARMSGTNALLGTQITSSTHLTPDEMHAVADAVESGLFGADWELVSLPLSDADAPPETEESPEVGSPAPLESLDENAMEFDLCRMRRADRARALSAIYAEKILLETRLNELEHALLCA